MTKRKEKIIGVVILCMVFILFIFSTNVSANEIHYEKGNIDNVKTKKVDSTPYFSTQNTITDYKKEFMKALNESPLKKESLNVCIYDDFKTLQKRSDNTTFIHGEIVKSFIEKYLYKSDEFNLIHLESEEYDFFNPPYTSGLMNCDIMNISMTFNIHDIFKSMIVNSLDNYLEKTNTLFVVSAGNEASDTSKQTVFSYYNNYINKKQRDNYLVVGQLEQKNSKYINNLSYGKEIDFMVANQWEVYRDYQYAGTSFSSPVITATLSNLMLAGLTKEEAKNAIAYTEYKDNIKTYPVFLENETYKNALSILKEKEMLLENNKDIEATKSFYNTVRIIEEKYFYTKFIN